MKYTDLEMVSRLSDVLRSESRKAASVLGLQLVHYEVLDYVGRCNRYSDTPMAVVEYLGLTKGAVSQTITLLVGKGYIKREKDEKDRRVSHLSLTETGLAILTEIQDSIQSLTAKVDCTGTYKKALQTVLKEMLWQLQEEDGRKAYGVCDSCKHNKAISDGSRFCILMQESLSETETEQICRVHEYAA